jgi:hypothetical protein
VNVQGSNGVCYTIVISNDGLIHVVKKRTWCFTGIAFTLRSITDDYIDCWIHFYDQLKKNHSYSWGSKESCRLEQWILQSVVLLK